jgi:DNA-binding PadR family transcriptional regulator
MLDKVDFPMTTSQISEFMLDKGYTTYFKLQEALSEMVDSGLLKIETTHNRTLYHLTENGAETIRFFTNKISPAIQNDVNEFLKEKQYDLKEEVAIKSDYYLNTNREYEVRCQIVENGFSLIDLKITVPTETEAETIAGSWSRQSQEIYALLLSKLL